MARSIHIRNVPEAMHRKLKVRARHDGRSLSSYLLHELKMIAERPTMEQMRRGLHRHEPVVLSEPAAETIRAMRGN